MTLLPKVKLRLVPSFPSNIIGGVGIDVTRDRGAVTVDMDWSEFGLQSSIPTSPTNNVLTFDTATQSYVMIPSSLLGGAVSGIADAPGDNVLYGRKNLEWEEITTPASSVKDFGAECDARQVYTTATISSGTTALTAVGAAFVAADVGKTIIIPGAGAATAGLQAVITAVVDFTHVTLSVAASTTLTGAVNTFITYGTDDTVTIQNAVNYFTTIGGNIGLSGKMLITAPIVIDCSADTMVWLHQGTSVNFLGAGSGNTIIIHSGCFAGPALDFRGHLSGGSPSGKQSWRGFAINSAIFGVANTTGIKTADLALSSFFDLMINGFAVAISTTDLLSCSFYSCLFGYNTRGVTAEFLNLSRPNAISFFGCGFGSCSDYAISMVGGTSLTIVGGSFENCGNTTSNLGAIYLNDPGVEGGAALSCFGVYFEGTAGLGDIVIAKSSADPVTVVADGCDFHRIGATAATYCIFCVQSLATTGKVTLSVRSSFRHFSYTPDISKPAIRFVGDPACEYEVNTSGSYFGSALYAWPETTPTPHAMVNFLGASGTVLNWRGVKSVVRDGVGRYTINLRNAMRGGSPVVNATCSTTGWAVYVGGTTTSVSLQFWSNATSALADPGTMSVVIYDAP